MGETNVVMTSSIDAERVGATRNSTKQHERRSSHEAEERRNIFKSAVGLSCFSNSSDSDLVRRANAIATRRTAWGGAVRSSVTARLIEGAHQAVACGKGEDPQALVDGGPIEDAHDLRERDLHDLVELMPNRPARPRTWFLDLRK